MSKIIRLLDRTRTVQDWKCERSRYLGYEFEGRGITSASEGLELTIGIIVHDCLAAIAMFTKDGVPVPIDAIAETAYKDIYSRIVSAHETPSGDVIEFATEQGTLIEGMIRGFYKHVWPKLMEKYPRIVSIESEMEYNLGSTDTIDFVFMTKPDLIVEDVEGNLVYLEYKTTSSKKDKWINSWDTQVQLHSSIKATEQTLGIAPAYVQIVGLYKGYESYGKQSSPFCYAYKRKGNPPFTKDETVYEYKAGFRRYATWELDGGVKAWVDNMPDNVLTNQFPMTAPIFVNDDLVKSFFRQRLTREKRVFTGVELVKQAANEDIKNDILDTFFPQKFDQCEPSFGWACQFKKICHGHVPNPLDEGFVLREPHHEAERVQLGLEKVQDAIT